MLCRIGVGAGGFFAGQLTSLGLTLPQVFCLIGTLVLILAVLLRLVYKWFAQNNEDKIVADKKMLITQRDKELATKQIDQMKMTQF